MVDTARHALGTILEDMSGQPGEHIGFCILRTLDAATEQGEASFDIVWKAIKGKARRSHEAHTRLAGESPALAHRRPAPSEHRALRKIVERGDLTVVEGQAYLVALVEVGV